MATAVEAILKQNFFMVKNRKKQIGSFGFKVDFMDRLALLNLSFENGVFLRLKLSYLKAFDSVEDNAHSELVDASPEILDVVAKGTQLNGVQAVDLILYAKHHLKNEIEATTDPLTYQRILAVQEEREMVFRNEFRKAEKISPKNAQLHYWYDDDKGVLFYFQTKNGHKAFVTLYPYFNEHEYGYCVERAAGMGTVLVDSGDVFLTTLEEQAGIENSASQLAGHKTRHIFNESNDKVQTYLTPDDFALVLDWLKHVKVIRSV